VRINFFHHNGCGAPSTEAIQQEWSEQFEGLRRATMVIEIRRDPDLSLLR
jgi:hypothetical protein